MSERTLVETLDGIVDGYYGDSYDYKRVRAALQMVDDMGELFTEALHGNLMDDSIDQQRASAANSLTTEVRTCGRDVCPPTSDCMVCR